MRSDVETGRSRTTALGLCALLAVGLSLVACTEEGGRASENGSSAIADSDEVLRYGLDLVATAGLSLDPMLSNTVGDYIHMNLLYDTLLHFTPEGAYVPGLASEFTMVDSSTIELTLRPGLRFHDGTPLDAKAVQFTIERNVAAHNLNHAPLLRKVEAVDVIDDLSVRIRLSTPTAGAFHELLAGRETMPVSPSAARDPAWDLDAHPVGAGPYRFEEFIPEQVLRLRRFEGHWDSERFPLNGIDLVHAMAGPSRVNALLSGDIDIADFAAVDMRALRRRSDLELSVRPSRSGFLYVALCKAVKPFDDVRVRQAIGFAIDRAGVNEAVLDGMGEVMWTTWPKDSPYYNPKLESVFAFDPARARDLLAEAGLADGFAFDIMAASFSSAFLRMAEILQAQLADVGLDVRIVMSSNIIRDLMNRRAPVSAIGWTRPGLQKVTRMFGPDSVANFCNYRDPAIDALTAQIAALPPDDSPEVITLWHELEEIIARDALVQYVAFQPVVQAWNTHRVGGVEGIFDTGQGIDFGTVYVKR